MINLSAVILTGNEEGSIERCLKSVSFCDEIVLIDDNSIDKTVNLAGNFGVKIYKRSLNEDFASQRNFGLSKAAGRWVLFLDADEEVDPALRNEILNTISMEAPFVGFYIKRADFIFGREIKFGELKDAMFLRLARRTAGKWVREVHEQWKVIGRVGLLKEKIFHYPHQTLREFIEHINLMSLIHAKSNFIEGKKSSVFKAVFWPIGKFVNNWIFKLGFMDGTEGFVISLIMSLHSFLAWSKLLRWQTDSNLKKL